MKNWETGLRPKISFIHKTILPTANPGTVSLFGASDHSHRDSGTSTNQSWLHACRNNIQGPPTALTIYLWQWWSLRPSTGNTRSQQPLLVCSPELSATAQLFLFLYLNLPGSLHLEFKFNSYLLHRIVLCTILSFTYSINIVYYTQTPHRHFSRLHLSSTQQFCFPPWSLSSSSSHSSQSGQESPFLLSWSVKKHLKTYFRA